MARKREVYQEIATALGVFVSGRDITTDDKKRFLECSSIEFGHGLPIQLSGWETSL